MLQSPGRERGGDNAVVAYDDKHAELPADAGTRSCQYTAIVRVSSACPAASVSEIT